MWPWTRDWELQVHLPQLGFSLFLSLRPPEPKVLGELLWIISTAASIILHSEEEGQKKNKLARSITEISKPTVMAWSDDLCAAEIRKKVNLLSSVYFINYRQHSQQTTGRPQASDNETAFNQVAHHHIWLNLNTVVERDVASPQHHLSLMIRRHSNMFVWSSFISYVVLMFQFWVQPPVTCRLTTLPF